MIKLCLPLYGLSAGLIAGFTTTAPVAASEAAVEEVAATTTEGAAAAVTAGEPSTWQIRRSTGEIKIDGLVDDAGWNGAASIPLRFETRPGENVEPKVGTTALITFDDSRFYVAFKAEDPEPRAIRAHLMDRDEAWNNDFVGVVLDPFNDQRRAFEFFANPLGVQMDLFFDDVGGNEDSSWDAIWNSAGQITERGYEVEFAIPFSSLRFPNGQGVQTWGIDVLRFYPRDERYRIASQPMDRDRNCYLCQMSKIVGIEGVSPGRNLEIVPTLTSAQTDTLDDATGELASGDNETDLGVTAKWGITPGLILNATLNPDFSNVEADVAQLDINEQFALFFPEKRPFFLEGADIFNTLFDVVFTRNVADPDWGVKFSGKTGNSALAVFAADDQVTNLLLPGSQGSSTMSLDLPSTDSAIRYRFDLGDNSSLGVIGTSRAADDYHNSVGGIDGRYRLSDSHSFDFQWLTSDTEYPSAVVEEFGTPAGSFSDDAYTLGYNYDSREWDGWFRYNDVGSGFRADMGFEPQVDFTFLLGGGQRTWWPEGKEVTQGWLGGDWDATHDQSGEFIERELEFWSGIRLPMQSWVEAGAGARERVFNGVDFEQGFYWSFLETQPTGNLTLRLFSRLDTDAIDFAHTRPGDQLRLNPEVLYRFGKHLQASVDYDWRRFDVEGGNLFSANLAQGRLVYQFNRRSFLRLISQYTTIDRNQQMFEASVSAESERFFNQLLFSYKVNPQTVLFLGYSDTRDAVDSASLERQDRSLFLKIGYAWVS